MSEVCTGCNHFQLIFTNQVTPPDSPSETRAQVTAQMPTLACPGQQGGLPHFYIYVLPSGHELTDEIKQLF